MKNSPAFRYYLQNSDLEVRQKFHIRNNDIDTDVSVTTVHDFESRSKYLKLFIPFINGWQTVLRDMMMNHKSFVDKGDKIQVSKGMNGDIYRISSNDLIYTNRIILWTDALVLDSEKLYFAEYGRRYNINIEIRDASYIDSLESHSRCLGFISHDSRDKGLFVRKLARNLSRNQCKVWYDEFSLSPGDSLRRSIEDGLKICPYCIIVLSPHYLENRGWASREFDIIYTREIVEQCKIMIPIWLGVTKEDIYKYSPLLVDIVGIDGSLPIGKISKILTAKLRTPPNDHKHASSSA